MIVYEELLNMIADEGKHTFISTGMSSLDDISKAVEIFRTKNCSFELMHCISTYPMKEENANLNAINTLRETFNCEVGYSGHESGLAVSYAAASLGISSLERHITLDRAMYGSDQAASLEPRGQKELISVIKKMLIAFGEEKYGYISKDEMEISKKLRAHLPLKK